MSPTKADSRPRPVVTPLIRRRRNPWRRIKIVAALLLVVALVAGGVWLVRYSQLTATARATVNATDYVSTEDVLSAAQVPMGEPLSGVDLAAIGARIARLPAVEEVTVERSWPNTVSVDVIERTPVYALKFAGGYSLVDGHGIMFANRADKPSELLTATAGGTQAQALGDVATVVAALPPELRERTQSVSAASRDTIKLNLTKGDTVVWGSAEQSDIKAQVALALLTHKGTSYNVTVPAHPTIT